MPFGQTFEFYQNNNNNNQSKQAIQKYYILFSEYMYLFSFKLESHFNHFN